MFFIQFFMIKFNYFREKNKRMPKTNSKIFLLMKQIFCLE